MIKNFYDTNALLTLQEKVLDEDFYISSTTLHELEHIKTSFNKSDEIKWRARRAVHLLDENEDRYKVIFVGKKIISLLEENMLEDTPDNRICACCKTIDAYTEDDVVFVTGDICCRLIARDVFGLNVEIATNTNNEEYKGFKEITLSNEDMAYLYEHMNENIYELVLNEYLIIKNTENEIVDKMKWDGEKYVPVVFKSFKSMMFGTLKPKDEIQECAVDSLINNDITVLYGKSGCGKTTLPLNYLTQMLEKGKINKIYMVYSYEPLKNAKVLGFEKGDHETKLLYSSSIGNILSTKFGDINQVRFMMENNQLEIIPTANIRGVEFEKGSALLVTESQNLDIYTLKTIIQRCKEGCKQIYEGDIIEQKDVNIQNIGIDRMIEVFKGHEQFGCVKLKYNYRNPLSELADLM